MVQEIYEGVDNCDCADEGEECMCDDDCECVGQECNCAAGGCACGGTCGCGTVDESVNDLGGG